MMQYNHTVVTNDTLYQCQQKLSVTLIGVQKKCNADVENCEKNQINKKAINIVKWKVQFVKPQMQLIKN